MPPTPKFPEGTKVRIVKPGSGEDHLTGQVGRVVRVRGSDEGIFTYYVQIPEEMTLPGFPRGIIPFAEAELAAYALLPLTQYPDCD